MLKQKVIQHLCIQNQHVFVVLITAWICCVLQSYAEMDPTTAALEREHEAVSISYHFVFLQK